MGCWNGSCVLSGLPIMDGDPAVAIPIVIHSGDSITPTFFPLFGEYNDYGSLTKMKSTPMSRKLVKLVKDSLTTDVDKKPEPTFNKARLLELIEMVDLLPGLKPRASCRVFRDSSLLENRRRRLA